MVGCSDWLEVVGECEHQDLNHSLPELHCGHKWTAVVRLRSGDTTEGSEGPVITTLLHRTQLDFSAPGQASTQEQGARRKNQDWRRRGTADGDDL